MATAAEALERMREICLSFPGTREGRHFGDTAFYVKGRLFATCGGKHGACEIVFGLEPERAERLVATDARFRPYPRDRRGVVVDAAQVKSWSGLRALLSESYELCRPGAPPRKPARKPAPRKRPRR